MRYLYKKRNTEERNTEDNDRVKNDFLDSCTICVLSPNPFKYKLDIEKASLKQYVSRLYFWIITAGRYKIYFLCNGNDVVHSSFAVSKCSKFPFMQKGDIEIGPCVTSPDYRRRGSYCYMLNYITSLKEYENAEFYMIVKSTNEASVKGIEKSGFIRSGTVQKKGVFKKYILEKEND